MTDNISVQLKKWTDKVEKTLGKDFVSKQVLKNVGDQLAMRVALRTRLGYGVPGNNRPKQSLKSMRKHSLNYTEWRFEHANELSGFTAPAKHNLTLTGDMLDNLQTIKIDTARKRVEIGFTEEFAKFKATINQNRGWRFLHISDIEHKAILNFYKREIQKLVKRAKLN